MLALLTVLVLALVTVLVLALVTVLVLALMLVLALVSVTVLALELATVTVLVLALVSVTVLVLALVSVTVLVLMLVLALVSVTVLVLALFDVTVLVGVLAVALATVTVRVLAPALAREPPPDARARSPRALAHSLGCCRHRPPARAAPMRLMRLEHDGRARYARWIDPSSAQLWTAAPWEGGRETEERVSLAGAALLPHRPHQDRVRRPQLPRARGGARQRGARRAAALPQAAERAPPARGHRGVARAERARGLRGRDRRGPRPPAPQGRRGRGRPGHLRPHLRRRRHGARPPAQGRAVHPRQGLRHLLPVRPMDRDGAASLDALAIETRVGGEVRQRGSSAAMIWSIPALLAFISGVMRLEPGDLVLTGTPEGVAPSRRGIGSRSRSRASAPSRTPSAHGRHRKFPYAERGRPGRGLLRTAFM
ncbi:MAG: fumarylacetoacetate hydrolase family protein [Sandaracinaceae bacterium]|nr:fumarylacetoacetate hydrolase family protein [Sandaracinaceae bacterium]